MSPLAEMYERIKARRLERGFTQMEVARRAGVSRIAIDRLENGRLSDIRYSTLYKILVALGLDLRLTELNAHRPTLEDLQAENER